MAAALIALGPQLWNSALRAWDVASAAAAGTAVRNHNEECRARFEVALAQTPEGRARLEAQTHIDKIPTETWEDDESDDHKCAVCQCNFERGEEMRVLGCSHRFHVDCIDGWLRGRPTCPMCKTSIKEEQAQQGADQELSQVAGAL